ncbi:MAG: hypothetical protein KatS3mg002_0748 [Candidatus Woesearchaeota archaeon]|nr:MAG: hypothetical protein KatS3mg002_0748 [Candidatus Woesearchaeota archaeon]
MINEILAIGMEKPKPERYLNSKLIDLLDNLKISRKCDKNRHYVVFVEYEINKHSSFFDMKPGKCSCGIYWKTLANNHDSVLREYYIKNNTIPKTNYLNK